MYNDFNVYSDMNVIMIALPESRTAAITIWNQGEGYGRKYYWRGLWFVLASKSYNLYVYIHD